MFLVLQSAAFDIIRCKIAVDPWHVHWLTMPVLVYLFGPVSHFASAYAHIPTLNPALVNDQFAA
jgi:hypothetical protein